MSTAIVIWLFSAAVFSTRVAWVYAAIRRRRRKEREGFLVSMWVAGGHPEEGTSFEDWKESLGV